MPRRAKLRRPLNELSLVVGKVSTRLGTQNAFYVRTAADETALSRAIRGKFPKAEVLEDDEFWGVILSEDDYKVPEHNLIELSSRLKTDVIWLSFQSVVDAFQFYYWRDGQLVRSLVYGCFEQERTWEQVEGEPEPWEREVFFDQKTLARKLEFFEDDPEKQKEFERIWRNAELAPGRFEPSLDARNCALKIAAFYQFPY